MKVMCLIDSLGSGGAQRQIVGLANQLDKNGFDVLVAWYHEDNFYCDYLKANRLKYMQIYAHNRFTKYLRVHSAIRKFNPDYIISYLDGPNTIACLARIFLSQHFGLIVSERNTTQRLSIKERIKFWIYKYADYIVPNSNSQAEFIIKNFDYLKYKVKTITNFVDTSFFIPNSHKKENPQNITKVLVVARINEQKNVLRFIRAVSLVYNKINLVVNWFGDSASDDYRNRCYKEVCNLGLQTYINFFPADKNILKCYHESDVFCLPSIFEGFPNVLCEAMSCGLPILCSDICDNARIVRNEENAILFNPLSEVDIANAILKFSKLSQDKKWEMGKQSRMIALKDFSAEVFVEKYIELLKLK